MATKRRASDVLREFELEHEREEQQRREVHRSVMDGFVEPLLQAGLVDDVEPDDAEEPRSR